MGALHGWAPIQEQLNFSTSHPLRIQNLFFTGHWTTGYGQGGIPWAINTAKRTANIILSNNVA
jgi:hypothetical protein